MAPAPSGTAVWLLDVDGVLNAGMPLWPGDSDNGVAYVRGRGYRLNWSVDLVERVSRQHRSGEVEVRWSTTWVDHIHQVERLMQLPGMRTAFTGVDPDSLDASGMKVEAALHVVEVERRPLIWTDDDAVPLSGLLRHRLLNAGPPVLLIRPHSSHGLQPADLFSIEDFLTQLNELAS